MAFLNRVGNVLKQAVSKHVSSQYLAPSASMFQAMRSMSTSAKLFVGGLSYSTDDTSLQEAFSQYGEVVEARVILDRETGRSRGFGFITFTSTEAASSAIQAFDGQDLHGRRVRVNYATEKPRGGGFGGGYGGGGGGYGGGGYGSGGGGYGGGGYSGGGGYGGGQGGNYGRGGYQSGGGGYDGGNQYPSQSGGFGGSGNYPSGGEGAFGGGGNSVQADGNYSSSGQTGFSSFSDFGTTGGAGEIPEAVGGQTEAGDEGFGQDSFGKDDNEEPSDYANTQK
ncbi:glycine-rich RNA-binding protein 2, mitochondrial-like [Salvia splendens]|uniref:glycine-rich RNA-binding protein 2, mitochondrial-like n=1 Tax=Salvia splendens TaxID=180675 RepID=UPI001C254FB3|nr:glycine-rich RNA-binding protein 2, mitochondrial-like [Salvia splendens]